MNGDAGRARQQCRRGWTVGLLALAGGVLAVLIVFVALSVDDEGGVDEVERQNAADHPRPPRKPIVEHIGSDAAPIVFTKVRAPARGPTPELVTGTWSGERLYAVTRAGKLFSTHDGIEWVDLGGEDDIVVERLDSDGAHVLAVGASPTVAVGSQQCLQGGDTVAMGVLAAGDAWTWSRLALPFAVPASRAGCHHLHLASALVGEGGFLVVGMAEAFVPFETQDLLASEPVQPGDRAELADEVAAFERYAADVVGPLDDLGQATQLMAWWSGDGVDWVSVDHGLPPGKAPASAIPTETGFVITTVDGEAAELTGARSEPTDPLQLRSLGEVRFGSILNVQRWQNRLVAQTGDGIVLVDDPSTVIIPRELFEGRQLALGELGALAFEGPTTEENTGPGSAIIDLTPPGSLLFSESGEVWVSWTPADLGELASQSAEPLLEARLVGMGDDFVVFSVDRQLLVGTLRPA